MEDNWKQDLMNDALYKRINLGPKWYPNYTPQDLSNINAIESKALLKKYGSYGSDLKGIENAMEADHGITPGSVDVQYTDPGYGAVGSTYFDRNKTPHVKVDPNESSGTFLGTLDHEMNHVAEVRNGTHDPVGGKIGPSDSNELPHFGSDTAGQMYPYEGKKALSLMTGELQDLNSPDSGLLDKYGPNGQALQSYINNKRQKYMQSDQESTP